ncbi:hypothetical protein GGI05_000199 [Coemansia sp. RSA 2603]|nr:hypothetical protein GGI05_000199 [Coemansia sp. RSA 2603]
MSIVVRTGTKTEFTVEEKIVEQMSGLKELPTETTEDGKQVSLLDEKIPDEAFQKAVEFYEYHKDDPEPFEDFEDRETSKKLDMCPWDEKFLDMDPEVLGHVTKLADALKAKRLVDAACKKLASMMRGKNADEIRKMFKIKEDFSDKEKEQIRKEQEWDADKSRY